MIVTMSKIEIAGEKTLLQDVLSLLRELKIFQIETAAIASIEAGREEDIRSFAPDDETVLERLFLEDLRLRIEDLFSHLPAMPVRHSYLDPLSIVDIIARTVRKHTRQAATLWEDRDRLLKEERELGPTRSSSAPCSPSCGGRRKHRTSTLSGSRSANLAWSDISGKPYRASRTGSSNF